MPHELITARNLSEGLHIPFIYINDVTGGIFIKMILLAVWAIVTFGLYFSQKKAIGVGDFPVAVGVSGLVLAVFTILLRLVPGLVDGVTFAVVLIISLISVLWLWFSRD